MKKFKKIFAVLGIIMVIGTTIVIPISADDGATGPQIQRNDLYNLQEIYLEGERTLTLGSPFTVFAYSDTFDSQDRFSVYIGNGQYENIQMVHWGEKKTHTDTGYQYYSVRTEYINENFQDNADKIIKYNYQNLLYWGGFARDLTKFNNGSYTNSALEYSLIPFLSLTDIDYGDNETVKVKYTYTIYEQKDIETEDGRKRIYETKEMIDTKTYYPQYGSTLNVPLFPVYNAFGEYTDIYFGKTTDEILNNGTIINVADLLVEIDIGDSGWLVEQYTYFDTAENPNYIVTMNDWINQNGIEIYRDVYLDVDVSDFLIESVGGFMGFEIYPGLTLIGIIGFLIAIPLLMLILKVFKD